MEIYSDSKFLEYVERLNVLYSDFDRWKSTKARKEHEDEFGDEIADGEVYFKRNYGSAYNEVLKLSKDSMEKMLFCIFNGNFWLIKRCDKLVEEERKKLEEAWEEAGMAKDAFWGKLLGKDGK